MNYILEGKKVFDIEIEALSRIRDALDEIFEKIVTEVVNCDGKVIITGIGKPGHIASKVAATLSSLGTPSFYLHPAEAMHGDLGAISENDIVIILSYSGESDEILKILPNIKMIGAKIIAITGNCSSTLAKNADIVQLFPEFDEACYLGLAPTSSTTAELVYGDAIAVVASKVYGFDDVDFGKFHPAGTLGKKLVLRVEDLMIKGNENAVVKSDANLKDAILEISKKALGMVSIVDYEDNLLGIITSGDLRRALEKNPNIYDFRTSDIMTTTPCIVSSDQMAVDILRIMVDRNYAVVPVVDDKKLVGVIRMHDILRAGIVDSADFSKKVFNN